VQLIDFGLFGVFVELSCAVVLVSVSCFLLFLDLCGFFVGCHPGWH